MNDIGNYKYFHGGVKNLKRGDYVSAPLITFNARHAPYISDADKAEGHCKNDKVYVTTDLNAARAYASSYPFGDVYEVEPLGNISADPDAPDVSLMCDAAKVISIVQRKVKFKAKRLERMMG